MREELKDEEFMRRAVALAQQAVEEGGGPFGALVAKSGQIVAEGKNQAEVLRDPTAHAEIQAIRAACRTLGTRWLTGHTLITSAEPCPMCLAACYWADIARIVYAVSTKRAEALGFGDAIVYREITKDKGSRSIPMSEMPVPGDEAPFHVRARLQPDLGSRG